MILKKITAMLFIIILTVLHSQESNASPNNKIQFAKDDAQLDIYIEEQMNLRYIPGLAACIIKNDTIIWSNNYGFADIENNKLVTDSTTFRLASISKTIVATTLMQLYEQNMFSLEDDINDYLPWPVTNPNFPDTPITFSMLMTHTSSIIDNWDNIPISTGDYTDLSLGSYLQEYLSSGGSYYDLKQFSNYNSPGALYIYSNVGASLCAYLVETITDMPFDQYCKENIFEPLGMNKSSWFLEGMDIDNLAIPYLRSGTYYPQEHYGYPTYPAGGLRTNKFELARFLTAYMQDGKINSIRILNNKTVSLMTSVQDSNLTSDQGLIWYSKDVPPIGTVWGHSGGNIGVNTHMYYSKSTIDKYGIVILSNAHYTSNLDGIISELFQYGLDYTSIEDNIASATKLYQNYPNPFNNTTKINYELFDSGKVKLSIFNTKGELVKTLFNGTQDAGKHNISFNASSFNSGIYYYKMEVSGNTMVNKMLLVK